MKTKSIILLLATGFVLASCSKDKPKEVQLEEKISLTSIVCLDYHWKYPF